MIYFFLHNIRHGIAWWWCILVGWLAGWLIELLPIVDEDTLLSAFFVFACIHGLYIGVRI
ncbi:hypothetical protein M432DRAFT_394871 [Thermoascus aurantiacus ATCC 26904]